MSSSTDLTSVSISQEFRDKVEKYREEYRREYGEKPGVTETVHRAIDCLVIDRFPEESENSGDSE